MKEKKSGALAKKASVFVSPTGRKIIIKPHITEKASSFNEKGVYIFKIAPKANKIMVKQAIKESYGVVPRKVNIVNIPPSRIFLKGRYCTKPGYKKAVVSLKKGEKIEIS